MRRLILASLALPLWIGPHVSWAVAQDEEPRPPLIELDPSKRIEVQPGGVTGRSVVPTPLESSEAVKRLRESRRQRVQESVRRRQESRQAEAREEANEEEDTPEAVAKLRQRVESNGSCKPMRPNERRAFNFNGDIQELVKAISKLTCNNFIITNKVRSQKFEIITGTPVSMEQIWRAFLSSLEANDFTLVRTGRYYKIVQANDGNRANLPIYGIDAEYPAYDRIVTKIWKLEHATDLDRVVNFLNFFKSAPGGQIYPYPETGIIVATDFGTIIAKLERILRELDQPGALEQVHVVPVKFASASEVADKLTQIFEPAAPAGGASRTRRTTTTKGNKGAAATPAAEAKEGEGPASVSKILADDRTNKLIIIASQSAFDQILSLLRELDVPEDGTQGQIHVVRLRHADAEELSSTLASLSQGRPAATTGRRTGNQPQAQASGPAALFEGEVKITADPATNSLVITASKSDFTSVQRVIDRLDVPRFQVFVEAVIMEVSTTGDNTLGVGFHGGVAPTIDGEQTPIIFSNTPSQDLSSLVASQNPLQLASLLGLAGAVRGPTLGGTEDIIQGGIPAIGVIVQALKTTNDVNVVSTPHLLTMDNEEAEIQVNEQRPFPSGLTLGGLTGLASAAGGANVAGNQALGALGGLGLGSVQFNREDVGLSLKLKPQINDEDYVRLEIEQELSDVAGIDQVTGQVITSNRSAKTVVVVRSQDSVVIGGLVRDRETRDESKTPILGDVPLIGWLFKRQQRVKEKINLLLVLTPYIVRGPEDFRKIFERKMEERKEFVDRFYGTTAEYRASIDWNRKVGPLAAYRAAMRKEMQKAENEGPGAPDETIIRPTDIEFLPRQSYEPGPDSGSSESSDGAGGSVPLEPRAPEAEPTLETPSFDPDED
jgi:general secretion pathway protein D